MGSIKAYAKNPGTLDLEIVWHDPDLSDVAFLIMQNGSLGLADRGYIRATANEIQAGDLAEEDAWDALLMLTSHMTVPLPCTVETSVENGEPMATFRATDGHRYTMKL